MIKFKKPEESWIKKMQKIGITNNKPSKEVSYAPVKSESKPFSFETEPEKQTEKKKEEEGMFMMGLLTGFFDSE